VSSESKDVSRNVTTRYHFQNITKTPLHGLCMDALQDVLMNTSTILVTLCFPKVFQIISLFLRHVPMCHKNMTRGKLRAYS
jgi:hypothetical protein